MDASDAHSKALRSASTEVTDTKYRALASIPRLFIVLRDTFSLISPERVTPAAPGYDPEDLHWPR